MADKTFRLALGLALAVLVTASLACTKPAPNPQPSGPDPKAGTTAKAPVATAPSNPTPPPPPATPPAPPGPGTSPGATAAGSTVENVSAEVYWKVQLLRLQATLENYEATLAINQKYNGDPNAAHDELNEMRRKNMEKMRNIFASNNVEPRNFFPRGPDAAAVRNGYQEYFKANPEIEKQYRELNEQIAELRKKNAELTGSENPGRPDRPRMTGTGAPGPHRPLGPSPIDRGPKTPAPAPPGPPPPGPPAGPTPPPAPPATVRPEVPALPTPGPAPVPAPPKPEGASTVP